MKTIDLKIMPEFFQAVKDGEKTFEVRKDDRNFEVGDFVRLYEYLPNIMTYTGRFVDVKISYILRDTRFCKEGYCIFSFVII